MCGVEGGHFPVEMPILLARAVKIVLRENLIVRGMELGLAIGSWQLAVDSWVMGDWFGVAISKGMCLEEKS